MKFKILAVIASALSLAATANAQNISSYFVNLDFDSGGVTTPGPFVGFDVPDIIGWHNNGPVADGGVEGPAAWWIPDDYAHNQAAFIISGASAYNLGDYTIQDGDIFAVAFLAQCWNWQGVGEWTATLFYDNPANVIGSYVTPSLANAGDWTLYTSGDIAATPGSVGGKLGILMANTGVSIAQMDEITVSIVPEPAAISLFALGGLGILLRRRFVK